MPPERIRTVSRWLSFLACSLVGASATAGPPRQREAEPLPLARAPELARRPVELVPRLQASLALCEEGAGRDRCESLAPALGGELAALHRPNPYFAFGGALGYSAAGGSMPTGSVHAQTLFLALIGRVYLLEEGPLDPYLEMLLGWASTRTRFETTSGARASTGSVMDEDAAFGPFGRAGGGVDWFVGPGVKLGVHAGFAELVLERGERCREGRCSAGSAPGGSVTGGVTAGFGLSVLFGESL